MSVNSTPNSSDDQEIDLSQFTKGIATFLDKIATSIFSFFLFLKRNFIILAILFVLGAILGYYLDKNNKSYVSEMVVKPNFDSGDYLYSKVALLAAKIKENDTVFLKNTVGIQQPKKLQKVDVTPVNDIYKFIENKDSNFEMLKLMAENSDIKKIMEDPTTSKNYMFHTIQIVTAIPATDKNLIQPLMAYLNDSDYLKKVQKEYVRNAEIKMRQNDSIVVQINGLLDSFSSKGNASSVYINQNTQINDIIRTKESFIKENGYLRVEMLNYDQIIKVVSTSLSKKNSSFSANNNKIILPLLFMFLFCFAARIKQFFIYHNNKSKSIKFL